MFSRIIYLLAVVTFLVSGLMVEIKSFEEKERQMEEIARINKRKEIIEKIPKQYVKLVVYFCDKYKVPIGLVYRLVKQESDWDRYARGYNSNGTVDRGLFQLNSQYLTCFSRAYFSGKRIDPYNPNHSIEVGIKMLSYYGTFFKGNWRKALYAYNWGIGRVIRKYEVPRSVYLYAQKILEENT